MQLTINENKVKLSNLDKVFWSDQNYTKNDLISYYIEIYPLIEDYLKGRPLSLKVYPDGIKGRSFFQKNCPDYAPDWLSTAPIYSSHKGELINWVTIDNLSDLVWVANHASIELHGWFSTVDHLDKPDFAVFDLDPGLESSFEDTKEIALLIKDVLDQLKLTSFIKTSGKTGLHIYIPVKPVYPYSQIRMFLKSVAEIITNSKPDIATTEWRKEKRKGKLYIDYRQNSQSKTIPAPYSLRPTPEATISTPLKWSELKDEIKPSDFTLSTIKNRIKNYGDLWDKLFKKRQLLTNF